MALGCKPRPASSIMHLLIFFMWEVEKQLELLCMFCL